VTAQFRFPRFFVTSPGPCPYLPGKQERKVFTDLSGHNPGELNDALGRIGFRRSQGVAYRPSCIDCSACISVRVITGEYEPNSSQKRIYRRNRDLEVSVCQAWSTAEQYSLLRRYLDQRHPDGGMSNMDEMDFADMVEQSPVDTHIVEYREPPSNGRLGELVGVCLSDRQQDGLSMIYSFFAPDRPKRPGLGTYIIMDHIARAASAGLPFVYLGYWIDGCRRMEYKARFQPMERLSPAGWSRMGEEAPLAVPLNAVPLPSLDALLNA
jgi:leucyl-tRNA---protein transferase